MGSISKENPLKKENTGLPDCFELSLPLFSDDRGRFVKVFHQGFFKDLGLNTMWQEEYYSVSKVNVLRGMHFQLPPHEHTKLVYCISGKILDVLLDVRWGSPTYGQCLTFELDAAQGNALYVPPGIAHGFLSLSDDSIVKYHVSSVYSPEHDRGILWNSFGLQWPVKNPILSPRDQNHPALEDFNTPFLFQSEKV